jgi:hypothetical protein
LNDGKASLFVPDYGGRRGWPSFGRRSQAASQQLGGKVFELAAVMDGSKLELTHEVIGKVNSCFHKTSLPASQFACQRDYCVGLQRF